MNILVVDDDRKVREVVSGYLTDAGFTVVTAKTGFEAIKVAAELRPSVVVIDGLLPEMHGFEVARYIRTLSADYQPRIILMTGIYKTNAYRSDAKLKYGVDEYLVKPIVAEELVKLVRASNTRVSHMLAVPRPMATAALRV